MVHVKKVEIFGFKSFGFRNTTVGFEPGLVSISGPNGSGKSNILDAVIFAMGENRPKVMRVDRLRSLLHDIEGTARRGPKLARVNVTFDNSDRKIPVDSDTVDVTREMDDKGDNTYYLNKKQTNRTQILDLLDVANAGLHQLNNVQQGTVTRISEFSPEEKRQTIEDLVGLSYFDQKKTEAVKQLDEADRRLEIALAKMGEIKKRIDELEEERNQKMRHDVLEGEINRLNAISAANRLREVRSSAGAKKAEMDTVQAEDRRLGLARDEVRERIRKIDAEKSGFMERADAYAQAKSSVDSELGKAIRAYEEVNGRMLAAQRRISKATARMPELEGVVQEARGMLDDASSRVSTAHDAVGRDEGERGRVDALLRELDGRRTAVLDRQSEVAKKRTEIDGRTRLMTEKLNEQRLAASKIESEMAEIGKRSALAASNLSRYRTESGRFADLLDRFDKKMKNHADSVAELRRQLGVHEARRARINTEIEEIGQILEKSTKAAAQYETKIRVVKGIMHEDYSIAQLQEDRHRLGIDGLVYQMISWDPRYERAVLAAGADWIKAFVVPDFATLLGLAEAAREKKLPKLKIIPMEAIPAFEMDLPQGRGVVGILSDFVRSKHGYDGLGRFLFGNVVLTDSRDAAYRVSRAGYRAVTLDGELFEAKAGAVVVDINSKISKLTKIITLSSSVDGLIESISLLRRYIVKKKRMARRAEDAIASTRGRLGLSEKEMAATEQSRTDLRLKATDIREALVGFEKRIGEYLERRHVLEAAAADARSSASELDRSISQVRVGYADDEHDRIAAELGGLNKKKAALEGERTAILEGLNKHSSELGAARADEASMQSRIAAAENELGSLAEERTELEAKVLEYDGQKIEYNAQVVRLRQNEQELIATSGTSVSTLKEFDDGLRGLHEREKSLSRQINSLERRSDSLSRDLDDLNGQRDRLVQILDSCGYGEDIETFDVEPLLAGLQAELRSLDALNAKAPETYVDVSSGYRSMSSRKNSLEEERNSIVRFIEGIEKDKRQTFLDAFDKVDKEIRQIFTKMTDGNAWLELQNEDDIFSSGISYLIQFPKKPKRESTSISGGEKTLAAIVFVLALQRLKPSPFYLFDEVDAHLDAPNSERLAKILEERAAESQFIMVSLKDSVVQRAKLIYGVFPKNGVSHVVTYRDKRMPRVASASPSTRPPSA